MRVLLFIALLIQTSCVSTFAPRTERADEVLWVTTADGWMLALHHFIPPKGMPVRGTPVVLCHGITSTRANWDLTDKLSFPADLARHGWDTYLLELRGGGRSQPQGFFDRIIFDDYVLQDVPAAVNFVAARGRTGQVHWVGHSMGGLIMYGYLERVGGALIRSFIPVASPPVVFDHLPAFRDAGSLFGLVDFFFDRLPSTTFSRIGAAFIYPTPRPELHMMWNEANMTAESTEALAVHAVATTSVDMLATFHRAAVHPDGHLKSFDEKWDYSAELHRIDVPTFFIAGGADMLAPPLVMMRGFAAASGPKRIEVFSRANGYAYDYGHMDLVVGESAPAEVYPVLRGWLRAHE